MRPAARRDIRVRGGLLWRAVEAQHVASTMLLVDTGPEQETLERILEASKPPVPDEARSLHYLLFTPFRYPPQHRGTRFRRPHDPGVFYGADLVRTACAELGYWRWHFLLESPSLDRMEPRPQTVFQAAIQGTVVDLREPPHQRRRRRWTDPTDYRATQAFAADARGRGIDCIRYESVRDPDRGGAAAVLHPRAFAEPRPRRAETWYLDVSRTRVRWVRAGPTTRELRFEFDPAVWS